MARKVRKRKWDDPRLANLSYTMDMLNYMQMFFPDATRKEHVIGPARHRGYVEVPSTSKRNGVPWFIMLPVTHRTNKHRALYGWIADTQTTPELRRRVPVVVLKNSEGLQAAFDDISMPLWAFIELMLRTEEGIAASPFDDVPSRGYIVDPGQAARSRGASMLWSSYYDYYRNKVATRASNRPPTWREETETEGE